MSQITATGFVRTSLPDRIAQLEDAYRAIFGANINLDPDTPDGQLIGVFAESFSNLDQLIEAVYLSISPSYAAGQALSRLVELNAIRRQAGAFSAVDVRFFGTPGTEIPAGTLVASTATQAVFATVEAAVVGGNGQVPVLARATEMGPVHGPAGTVTRIDTPIYGVDSAANETDATLGFFEETDAQLRLRRARSTAAAGQGLADALYGALANLPGVSDLRVYENATGVVQPVTGLPEHSIMAVVLGGADQAILDALLAKKSLGVETVGSTAGVAIDARGNPQQLRFQRPREIALHVRVDVARRAGFPADGPERIRAALAAWGAANLGIAQDVIVSRMYDAINSVPGHSIGAVLVGSASPPTASANVAVPFDSIARLAASRIAVNVTQ